VTPTVVDTSVLIDLLRGDDRAVQWLMALDAVPLCSEVTERLLQTLRWVAVDESVSRSAGDLGRRFAAAIAGSASLISSSPRRASRAARTWRP
jgi:predicted nucleic acid-binding protein